MRKEGTPRSAPKMFLRERIGDPVVMFARKINTVLQGDPREELPNILAARDFLRDYPDEAAAMPMQEFEDRFGVPILDMTTIRILLTPRGNPTSEQPPSQEQ
jgi:hypothetical protein